MLPYSDLNIILQDGASFEYQPQTGGTQKVTISIHKIAELILTSGTLLAWDLLMGPDDRYHFKRRLKPGRYPVSLSVAEFLPSKDARIACAILTISNDPPVRWEVAEINDPDPNPDDVRIAYGVDSGTGCFMDVDAALSLNEITIGDDLNLEKFEKYCDKIIAEMDNNNLGGCTACWARMKVSELTEANIITFSSGWGDGGYASYWGFDESGNLTTLVTDFALF